MGPELRQWNDPATWKYTYAGRADGLLCFGQDLFGVQFAITADHQVVAFDPETADTTVIGASLNAWARWLLDDPVVRAGSSMATLWQGTHGPLDHTERLLPRQPFVLGGAYDLDNLSVEEAAKAMRIRGPVAQQLHDAPNGSRVLFGAPSGAENPPMDVPAPIELSVFADYNVFFLLADDTPPPGPKTGWVDEVIATMIAARPGVVCIGTARRMAVPVTITVRPNAPEDVMERADHVTEASLRTTTGQLRIVDGSEVSIGEPQLAVAPGTYRVRVYSSGFDTLSDDALDGDDRYRLVAWPAEDEPPRVLKRYPGKLPGG